MSILRITNSMQYSPSWEADSHSVGQWIPPPFPFIWHPKVHYGVCKHPSLEPILSPMNPVHNVTPFRYDPSECYHLIYACLPNGLFYSGFATKILHTFLISPVPCPCHESAFFLQVEKKGPHSRILIFGFLDMRQGEK